MKFLVEHAFQEAPSRKIAGFRREKRSTRLGNFPHVLAPLQQGALERITLLVVDEPMVGLDPRGARLLKDVLREEARERGMTVLLSTHTLEVADEVADEIAVIHRGQLVARGTPAELREETGGSGQRLEEVFLQLTEEADEGTYELA